MTQEMLGKVVESSAIGRPYPQLEESAGGNETDLTPEVDFVHFVDEMHPRITSAGQTIGKLQSHAVTQEMLATLRKC